MADPRDDFAAFDGNAHMLFGLRDPFGTIRETLEDSLRGQVASTRVEAIRCHNTPRFLTLGRKHTPDDGKVIVTHWGTCFGCTIALTTDTGAETLTATVTLCFGDIDQPGSERSRIFLDLGPDAPEGYAEETFRTRFLTFRYAPESESEA